LNLERAAVIVGPLTLLFVFNPHTAIMFQILWYWFRKLLRFRNTRCHKLKWGDIPDGYLEDMVDNNEPLNHDPSRCLESTIGRVFSEAWSMHAHRNTVPKPRQLKSGKEYICTDARTLKAYALLTHPRGISKYEEKPVVFTERIGDILVARLTGEDAYVATGLRKIEVKRLLDGYPPFYRTKIKTQGGITIPSPLRSGSDIQKAGWIIAAGLTRTLPVLTHNMESETNDPTHRIWQDTRMRYAVNFFDQILQKIRVSCPKKTEEIVEQAVKSRNDIPNLDPIQGFLTHQLRHHQLFNEPNATPPDCGAWAHELAAEEWRIAMKTFNNENALTADEIGVLHRHMKPILRTAIVGLTRVMFYGHGRLTPTSLGLAVWKLPPFLELQDPRTTVYLERC
ncbi:hypothetical protein GP486_005818, partial [Trichoglossum hirsutum]